MNIKLFPYYANEYVFHGNNTQGISAFQLDLDDTKDESTQIVQFLNALKIDVNHLYLLIYISHGPFYNKIMERKKIWGLYPEMEFSMVGDTHTYIYSEGIVFASYVRLDKKSLCNGIELLLKYHLQASIIYSPNNFLESETVKQFYERMFYAAPQDKCNNPSAIFMNFNTLISHFCNHGAGVIRYGTDGCSSEISYFTKGSTSI